MQFRGGNAGMQFRSAPPGFRSGAVAQFRGNPGVQFRGAQFRGNQRFVRNNFRGRGFGFVGAPYYGYGYPGYYYGGYDDGCYQTQTAWNGYEYEYVRVYVCDY
jgi:hypothetical protein